MECCPGSCARRQSPDCVRGNARGARAHAADASPGGAEATSIRKAFEQDWRETLRIIPTEAMVLRAGDLADQFGLRGYDSVHLAAAESLRLGRPAEFVVFASFDRALNRAAHDIGLPVLAEG